METVFTVVCFIACVCAVVFGIKCFKHKRKQFLLPFVIAVVVCFGSALAVPQDDPAVVPDQPSAATTSEPSITPEASPSATAEPSEEPSVGPSATPDPGPEETPSVAPSQAPSVDPEQAFRDSLRKYKYVGSSESDRYHVPICRWTSSINDGNLVHFDTAEEARAAGYSPCGSCHPD